MKKALPVIIILILLPGLIYHVRGQSISNRQKDEIKNQVDSVFQEMIYLAEKMNYDELSKGVDDKYNAGFIVNARYYTHYDSLINNVKTGAQGVKNQNISIDNKKITVLSDSLVLLTSSGISEIALESGPVIKVNFFWSFIFEKIDNNWKVIHSHQSRLR